MSTDLVNTAFGVLNSERAGKSSKQLSVTIDFRQEHERSTLSFLGMTSTDIEAANYWNGRFMSCDKTEQQSSIQDAAPTFVRWAGIEIPLLDVDRKSRDVAYRVDELRSDNKVLARSVLEYENGLIGDSSLQKIQALEVEKGKLNSNSEALKIAVRHLEDLQTMKDHRVGSKVPSPILVEGKSKVVLKYYGKEPASAEMLGYLATARAKTRCTWEQLRLVAPKAATTQREGKPHFRVNPCPAAVYKALDDKYKTAGSRKIFPPAHRKGWQPAEITAYSWCALIWAFNRSWGGRSDLIVDSPKGFSLDRRFANATKKSIQNRVSERSQKPQAAVSGASLEEVTRLIRDIMRPKEPPSDKKDNIDPTMSGLRLAKKACKKAKVDMGDYSWMIVHLKRIIASADSAEKFLRDHYEPLKLSDDSRTVYSEASYVYRKVTDLKIEFGADTLLTALESWTLFLIGQQIPEVLEYFNDDSAEGYHGDVPDEEWYASTAAFKEFLHPDTIRDIGAALRTSVFPDEKVEDPVETAMILQANEDVDAAISKDRAASSSSAQPQEEVKAIIASPPTVFEELDEEMQRVRAADKVNHAACTSMSLICSFDLCPNKDSVIYAEFCDDEVYTDRDEKPLPESDEEPDAWLPDISIPDYVEEDGRVFVRVVQGVTMDDSSGSQMLASRRNAFPAVFRHGQVYVCTAVAIKLPSPRETAVVTQDFIPDVVIQTYRSQYPRVDPSELRASVPTLHVKLEEKAKTEAPKSKGKEKEVVKPSPPPVNLATKPVAPAKTGTAVAVKKDPKASVKTDSSSPKKGKKAAKERSAETDPSAMDAFYAQFTEFTGESHSSKDATINGKSRKEWIGEFVADSQPKGVDTQQAGCICTSYPCRHTHKKVYDNIMLNREQSWRTAFGRVSGKTSASAPNKKGGPDKEQVERSNPLRTKNAPRSSLLSKEQEESLRTFFKLPAKIPAADYAVLSKEDKAKIHDAGSIPRWATALVLRDAKNLVKITSGQMTKELSVEELKKPLPRLRACATEWTKLKERFEGVQLLEKPRTGKQKALRSAYDKLAKEFPQNPSLPKPKTKEGKDGEGARQQKPSAPSQPVTTGSGDGLAMLLSVLKELAPVIKLFK